MGIMKFARISRIIKLMRIFRVVKVMKQHNTIGDRLRKQGTTVAFQRIFVFFLVSVIVLHTASCLWIFSHKETQGGELRSSDYNTWITNFDFIDLPGP